MDKDKIIMIAIVAMVLIASVQAIQLFGIKSDIKEGGLSVSKSSTTAKPSSGSNNPVVDIKADIPDQVGGCF